MASEKDHGLINSREQELFISLFEADKNRLYSFIYAFVTNSAVADDIFQETSMTLWEEFSKFSVGTDFSKWANGIAYNRIRTHRRKNKKYTLGFSDTLLESLSVSASSLEEDEKEWQILQDCQAGLPEHLRKLYNEFYVRNLRAQEVAEGSGRSIFAIRKAIHKLRKKLFDCVEFKKDDQH